METLLKAIEEEGRKEIEEIRKSCESEIREIRKKYEEEAKKVSGEILNRAGAESRLIKERIISHAKMKAKDMTDERKHDLIEEVFEKAEKNILGLSDSEKKKILEKLSKESGNEIKNAKIFVDRKYSRLLPEAEIADINDFGIILKSVDGKEMIVNTLRERMVQIKNTKRHKIARVLFS